MSRGSKRPPPLASADARVLELERQFRELNSEAQDALHEFFRKNPNGTTAPMAILQSLGTLLERMKSGVKQDVPDDVLSEIHLQQFLKDLPDDPRITAAFQASCLLLQEITEVLLCISQERSSPETKEALTKLLHRLRPPRKKSSGTYEVRRSKFPPVLRVPDPKKQIG